MSFKKRRVPNGRESPQGSADRLHCILVYGPITYTHNSRSAKCNRDEKTPRREKVYTSLVSSTKKYFLKASIIVGWSSIERTSSFTLVFLLPFHDSLINGLTNKKCFTLYHEYSRKWAGVGETETLEWTPAADLIPQVLIRIDPLLLRCPLWELPILPFWAPWWRPIIRPPSCWPSSAAARLVPHLRPTLSSPWTDICIIIISSTLGWAPPRSLHYLIRRPGWPPWPLTAFLGPSYLRYNQIYMADRECYLLGI